MLPILKKNLSAGLLLFGMALIHSCKPTAEAKGDTTKTQEVDISVQLADAAMYRFDSLVSYNHPKKIKWQYDIAFLGMSIDKLGSLDYKYSEYFKEFYNYFIDDEGHILNYKKSDFNLDNINPAKGLITLYKRTGEKKYLKAIDYIIDQMNDQPRTPEGGFWHKKVYPQQMWLDGIYMYSPFLAQYAKEFNQPQWFRTINDQITLIYNKTLNPENGLLFHAWDASKSQAWCNPASGQSQEHWGRSMGWFTMAIVDLLDYYPQNGTGRDSLISILKASCIALLEVMDPETDLWYQVLDKRDKEGNYLEASASMMFIYVFAKGANKGYLPHKYYVQAKKSYDNALDRFIKRDENDGLPLLVNTCGGCGLGGNPYRDGTYEYYINEKQVNNDPKGLAPFILASLELKR